MPPELGHFSFPNHHHGLWWCYLSPEFWLPLPLDPQPGLCQRPWADSQPLSVPIAGDRTGMTGSAPHHLGPRRLRLSQLQVRRRINVLSAFRPSNMPGKEGGFLIFRRIPNIGRDRPKILALPFNLLLSSSSTSRLLPLTPRELLCALRPHSVLSFLRLDGPL